VIEVHWKPKPPEKRKGKGYRPRSQKDRFKIPGLGVGTPGGGNNLKKRVTERKKMKERNVGGTNLSNTGKGKEETRVRGGGIQKGG